jgi:protein-L-isoaspartate(D-aspartate) O-methyltransferase
MTLEDCRRFYADEVRFAANLHSQPLIDAFAAVPREYFLGPGPWEIGSAESRAMSAMAGLQMSYTPVTDPRDVYHNVVIALDKASDINNGQPSALARWIDALALKSGDRAYHLGCGVGYYTAIIAEVVGTGGSVIGVDVNPALAARAQENLRGSGNVAIHVADGATFDPGECDAMLVNAGCTHPLPLWLDCLRDGGRLVVPLTMATSTTIGAGVMTRITRRGTAFGIEVVSSLMIYSCVSARDPQREALMRSAMTGGRIMKVKSVRRDAHEAEDTCIVHGAGVCLSSTDAAEASGTS